MKLSRSKDPAPLKKSLENIEKNLSFQILVK